LIVAICGQDVDKEHASITGRDGVPARSMTLAFAIAAAMATQQQS
jgi:hypothetical protein